MARASCRRTMSRACRCNRATAICASSGTGRSTRRWRISHSTPSRWRPAPSNAMARVDAEPASTSAIPTAASLSSWSTPEPGRRSYRLLLGSRNHHTCCGRVQMYPSRKANSDAPPGSHLVLRRGGLCQPVAETDLAEVDRVRRQQAALLQLGAEVARLRVGDDRARIALRPEALADELIEGELLGTCNLNDAISRRPQADLAHRSGDVVGCDRLDPRVRQPNRVTVRGLIRDPHCELEELGRMDDREGDRGIPDQLLLGN